MRYKELDEIKCQICSRPLSKCIGFYCDSDGTKWCSSCKNIIDNGDNSLINLIQDKNTKVVEVLERVKSFITNSAIIRTEKNRISFIKDFVSRLIKEYGDENE